QVRVRIEARRREVARIPRRRRGRRDLDDGDAGPARPCPSSRRGRCRFVPSSGGGGRRLREGQGRGRRACGEDEDAERQGCVGFHGLTNGRMSASLPFLPGAYAAPFLGVRVLGALLVIVARSLPTARITGRPASLSASPSPSLGDTRTTSRSGRSRSAARGGAARPAPASPFAGAPRWSSSVPTLSPSVAWIPRSREISARSSAICLSVASRSPAQPEASARSAGSRRRGNRSRNIMDRAIVPLSDAAGQTHVAPSVAPRRPLVKRWIYDYGNGLREVHFMRKPRCCPSFFW